MKAGGARPNLQLRRYIGEKLGFIGEYKKKRIDKMLIINALLKYLLGSLLGRFLFIGGNS